MTNDQKHNLRHAAVIAAIVISAILHALVTGENLNAATRDILDQMEAAQTEEAFAPQPTPTEAD